MKIYDWKTLSGIIYRCLSIFWWIMLILMILGVPLELSVLFYNPDQSSIYYEVIGYVGLDYVYDKSLLYKILMVIQIAIVVPVILNLIRKMKLLFLNLSQEKMFIVENTTLLLSITKLVLILSIATLNLLSFFIGIFLWILVAVFKQGGTLQEESDWTV